MAPGTLDDEVIGASREAKRTRASVIYDRIREYCEMRVFGIGGYYRQESYRILFLEIYVRARQMGLAGTEAIRRCEKRRDSLKKKRIQFSDYVITAWSVRESLNQTFLVRTNDPNHKEMVDELCDWWESWDYLLDRISHDLKNVIPETPRLDVSLKETEELRHVPGVFLSRPRDLYPKSTDDPLWKDWPK